MERHRFWSIIYLITAVIALYCAYGFKEQRDQHFSLASIVGALLLSALALCNLMRARAFVIHRGQGNIEIYERKFLRKGTRTLLPLKALEVFLQTRIIHHRHPRSRGVAWVGTTHKILINIKGSNPIIFSPELRGPEGEMLAKTLSQDLGCPMQSRVEEL